MKILKILTAVLLAILALLLSACEGYDDDFSNYFFTTFGTLTKEGRAYHIFFDDKDRDCLVADSTAIARAGISRTPQRVLASYSDLSLPPSGTGTVKLLEITPMPTTDLSPAPATEEEREQLGTSGVEVGRAWVGGGYLNVMLRYPYAPSDGTTGIITAFNTGISTDGIRTYELRCLFQPSGKSALTPMCYVSFALPDTIMEETLQYGAEYRGAMLRYIGLDGGTGTTYIETGGNCQIIE